MESGGYAAAAGSSAPEWLGLLTEAEQLTNKLKFFDGINKIDACMELYEKTLGCEGGRIKSESAAFVEENVGKISEQQKGELSRMFALRGDILVGLEAFKRAEAEYSNVLTLTPDNADIKAKRDKLATPDAFAKKDGKVACTILTGFLGSGKTTLLNHILSANHGKRIAVIENEFGEVGIDDSLVGGGIRSDEENIVEMNNGCICCTVRGDLIAGLKKLVKAANKSGKPLDGVLIETTGLADPAPVAQTFFADDFVQQHLRLDGILTVVDAMHVIQHLDEEKPEGVENEAVEQIAFADRILLNKCDLVDEAGLEEVEKRIRAINAPVPIKRTKNSEVDMTFITGIRAFSLDEILAKEDTFLDDGQEHQHDDRVSSVGVDVQGEVDKTKLNEWLAWLLKERGVDIFRCKGVLAVKDLPEKYVFQAIHMIFSGTSQKAWEPGEERRCKMIFIGKNLDREDLTAGFMKCIV